MDRFKYKELTIPVKGGLKLVGVVYDEYLERVRIQDVSKYQAKVWIRNNQEEMFPYLETN